MASSSLVGELGKLYEVWYNIEGNGGSALAINLPWPQSIYPPDGRLLLSPDAHIAGNRNSLTSESASLYVVRYKAPWNLWYASSSSKFLVCKNCHVGPNENSHCYAKGKHKGIHLGGFGAQWQ